MSKGSGVITRTNANQSNGGIINGLRNGLSIQGGWGELGANPLIHTTSIDLDTFDFSLLTGPSVLFFIDPVTLAFRLGDASNLNNNTFLFIDDPLQLITLNSGGGPGLRLDFIAGTYQLGDISGAGNSMRFLIDDPTELVNIVGAADVYLTIDGANDLYRFGKLSTAGAGQLNINNAADLVTVTANGVTMLNLDAGNDLYEIGDTLAANNGTKISIDDSTGQIFLVDASLAGATNGDLVTLIDQTTGEIGFAPGPTVPTLAAGTYTPTGVAVNNCTAVTPSVFQYMRVGNTVTLSGRVSLNNTLGGVCDISLTPPIASNFATIAQAAGSGCNVDVFNQPFPITVFADFTNNVIYCLAAPGASPGAGVFILTVTYLIV